MILKYPFYIKLNNEFIKISDTKQALFDYTYIEKNEDQIWIISDMPIDIILTKNKNKITFGRLSKNDILLTNKQATRRHCDLIKHNNYDWTVYDLNSKNGTFINGKPVKFMQDISDETFRLQTGGNSWLVNVDEMKVRTSNHNNFHKYPLFGGEIFSIGEHNIEIVPFDYGISSYQGRRITMEDQHAVIPTVNNKSFYMIFDGHGGGTASLFVKSKLEEIIKNMTDNTDINEYRQIFNNLDTELKYTNNQSGTTANIVIIGEQQIDIINTGDCQALIIYEHGFVISPAHRPENEINRIPKKYLFKHTIGPLRIMSSRSNVALSVSRSIGDPNHDLVISTPDKTSYNRYSDRGNAIAIIQGCDGVWDFMEAAEVETFVRNIMHLDSQTISKELANEIYGPKSGKDNITIIAIKL